MHHIFSLFNVTFYRMIVVYDAIEDSLTPTVLSLLLATAVLTDTVVICGMRIGNLQFALCVIILLGAMALLGVIPMDSMLNDYSIVVRWKELNEIQNLMNLVLFEIWGIILFGEIT